MQKQKRGKIKYTHIHQKRADISFRLQIYFPENSKQKKKKLQDTLGFITLLNIYTKNSI